MSRKKFSTIILTQFNDTYIVELTQHIQQYAWIMTASIEQTRTDITGHGLGYKADSHGEFDGAEESWKRCDN